MLKISNKNILEINSYALSIFSLSLLFLLINMSFLLSLQNGFPAWNLDTLILNYYYSDLQYLVVSTGLSELNIYGTQSNQDSLNPIIFPIFSSLPQIVFVFLFGNFGFVVAKFFIPIAFFLSFTFLLSSLFHKQQIGIYLAFVFTLTTFYDVHVQMSNFIALLLFPRCNRLHVISRRHLFCSCGCVGNDRVVRFSIS